MRREAPGAPQFNHDPVLIAADGRKEQPDEKVGGPPCFERPAEVIAEVHDLVNAKRSDVRKHGFERDAVAVDVGDRSQFHRVVPCLLGGLQGKSW